MLITNGHLSWCPTLSEPCHCKTAGYVVVGLIALMTAALEIWGGGTSMSLALLGDAWHVCSDVVVYAVAIWGNILSIRNPAAALPTKRRWAVVNANVLIAVAVVTALAALWRMLHPAEILVGRMLSVALVGLAANVLMYVILRTFRIEHEHGEAHDHLHDTTVLHTAADAGLSLVVIAAALTLAYVPSASVWRIDSVASLVICGVLVAMARETKKAARQTHHHHH